MRELLAHFVIFCATYLDEVNFETRVKLRVTRNTVFRDIGKCEESALVMGY